jgi:hypothetical protein
MSLKFFDEFLCEERLLNVSVVPKLKDFSFENQVYNERSKMTTVTITFNCSYRMIS